MLQLNDTSEDQQRRKAGGEEPGETRSPPAVDLSHQGLLGGTGADSLQEPLQAREAGGALACKLVLRVGCMVRGCSSG